MKVWSSIVGALLVSFVDGSRSAEGHNHVRRGGRKLGFFNSAWKTLKEAQHNWETNRQWIIPTQDQEKFDIVIIGAGMAGLAAAKEIQDLDPSLTYLILESTDQVGGRVRSTTFGAVGNQFVIEDGANWLYDSNNYPTWKLAEDLNIESTFSDYEDFTMYDETVSTSVRVTHFSVLMFLNITYMYN